MQQRSTNNEGVAEPVTWSSEWWPWIHAGYGRGCHNSIVKGWGFFGVTGRWLCSCKYADALVYPVVKVKCSR